MRVPEGGRTSSSEGDGVEPRGDPHRRRRAFGQELRTWYERRGVSLRRLGDLIPCGFALIHRAAQGKDWPAPWFVVRADWCLGADRRVVGGFVEGRVGGGVGRGGKE